MNSKRSQVILFGKKLKSPEKYKSLYQASVKKFFSEWNAYFYIQYLCFNQFEKKIANLTSIEKKIAKPIYMYIKDIRGHDVRIRLLSPSRVWFYNICVISDRTVAVAFNPSSVLHLYKSWSLFQDLRKGRN